MAGVYPRQRLERRRLTWSGHWSSLTKWLWPALVRTWTEQNDNKLQRDVLRMTKDNLRAAKEDLSYERSERKRLEEQLQEKMAEIEKLRADKSVQSERCESNTVVKIVTTGPAMDSDTRRKMLEDIKNSLRYLPFNIT